MKARKDSLLITQEQWRERLTKAGYELVDGVASFEDAHTVRVGERHLSAERILVATGSRTAVPPIEGLDEVDWLDHVSALELTELPETLLVVGGGAVGLEFAQAFARFGSKVTIVEGVDRIAFRDDKEAAAELAAALRDEGIEIVTGALRRPRAPRPGESRTCVATVAGRGDPCRRGSCSRRAGSPNVEELNLERAGIERTKAGIARRRSPAHERRGRLGGGRRDRPLPVHADRAVPGADSRCGHVHRRRPEADYSALPTAIFTDPELAGASARPSEEARDEGLDVEVVTHPLSAVTRAQYTDSKRGLYKVVFERALAPRRRRPRGQPRRERRSSRALALALKLGATVDDLARVHPHVPEPRRGREGGRREGRGGVDSRP